MKGRQEENAKMENEQNKNENNEMRLNKINKVNKDYDGEKKTKLNQQNE